MSSPDLLARVEATEASLTGAPLVDAHLDPAGAAAAARAEASFWLRALPEGGAAAGDGYGPAPTAARWLRVTRGQAELAPAGDATAEGEAPRGPVHATSIAVVTEEVAWGTSAAPFTKAVARVVIESAAGRLVIAAAIADAEDGAREAVTPFASALGAALGVPVTGAASTGGAPGEAGASPARDGAPAPSLVRFTLGWEGDRLVLRDAASRGPRESAGVWLAVVAGSLVGAAIAALSLRSALAAGAPWTSVALRAGIVAVFALGAFAFFHVARHAIRYRAPATAIAVFADDRVVAAPWLRRDGAIDRRPEGRYGAGVRVAEVRRVHVIAKNGAHVVSLDTEHGPIDVADLADPARAEALRAVVEQALAGVASPVRRKTALMRGRERAAAAT